MTKEAELVMNRSKFSIAKTALSYLYKKTSKSAFTVGMINGFASQISPIYKAALIQQVCTYYHLLC